MRWLETTSSSGTVHEESSSSLPSTSAWQQGHRWFSAMQGFRRSLDLHLKNYYKIDNAFASTLKHQSAADKLMALTRAVTDTGLVDFCCVFLVHPGRGTFGVVAISGDGSELYPPRLGDKEAQRAARLPDPDCPSFLNVFNRCVFQVKDSNWSVEDVVASCAPWYYDCASAANGFGLPQDGGWLRRAGMRSMLALPCMQGHDVTGVLAVASRQKSLDHLLLRKLEELCFKVTPTITEAVVSYSPLLCNSRVVTRYESFPDFAHEVLGEVLNLDRAVSVAVNRSSVNVRTTAAVPAESQQQGQRPGAGKALQDKAAEERSAVDVTAAAVAAAAAAGFSCTAPPAAAAAAAIAAASAAVAAAANNAKNMTRTMDTCSTANMVAPYSVVLTADLASGPLTQVGVPSAVTDVSSQHPTRASAVVTHLATAHGSKQQASGGWSRTPCMNTSRSLPERQSAAPPGLAAMDFLRSDVAAAAAPVITHQTNQNHHQRQQHLHPQQPSVAPSCAVSSTSSACRNASRSTRSLSCLEFSGGVNGAREEPATGSGNASGIPVPLPPPGDFAAVGAAAAATVGGSSGSSSRTTESVRTVACMSYSMEDLTSAWRNAGSVNTIPSLWSCKNMESRVMHRGMPLESSVDASPAAAPAMVPPPAAETATTFGYHSNSNGHHVKSIRYGPYGPYGRCTSRTSSAEGRQAGADGCPCAVRDLSEVRTTLHGVARGRWSRDSVAAAAAVWSNETADAVDAAARFTASRPERYDAQGDGGGTAKDGKSAEAVEPVCTARANDGVNAPLAAGACPAAPRSVRGLGPAPAPLGALYGIRESGTVPSLQLSLELDSGGSSDDGAVALIDVASPSMASEGGVGFVVSSGLGAEAVLRHHHRQHHHWGGGCGGDEGRQTAAAAYKVPADLDAATSCLAERRAAVRV